MNRPERPAEELDGARARRWRRVERGERAIDHEGAQHGAPRLVDVTDARRDTRGGRALEEAHPVPPTREHLGKDISSVMIAGELSKRAR